MSTHLISRSDIRIDESKPLGQGAFGVVFKGTRKGGSQVAVKRLLPGMTEKSKAAFHKEVAIMCSMRSEFVVPVYGVVDDSPDQPVLLIMKLMHQSLHSALHESVPPPSLWQRVKWLVQAGKGIEFLHAHQVLHRDIKPLNMLISSPDTGRCLELSDFGLSKNLADITSASMRSAHPSAAVAQGVGTPYYKAPEIMSVPPEYATASHLHTLFVTLSPGTVSNQTFTLLE
jgi:serine/threonine protein kinase